MRTGWLVAFYGKLLQLFPQEFKAEFEEEMKSAFKSFVEDAAGSGRLSLFRLCLFEILDLPVNIIQEHFLSLQRGKAMNKISLGTQPWRAAQLGGLGYMLGSILFMIGQLNIKHPSWWYDKSQIAVFQALVVIGLYILACLIFGICLALGSADRHFSLRIILGIVGGGFLANLLLQPAAALFPEVLVAPSVFWLRILFRTLGNMLIGFMIGLGLGFATGKRKSSLRMALLGMASFGVIFLPFDIVVYLLPRSIMFVSNSPASFMLIVGFFLTSLCSLLQGGLFGWFWGKENIKQTGSPLEGNTPAQPA